MFDLFRVVSLPLTIALTAADRKWHNLIFLLIAIQLYKLSPIFMCFGKLQNGLTTNIQDCEVGLFH